jgi:formate dehydrogenase major subunit
VEKVKLTIDGTEVEVARGTTVLDAAREVGKEIPTLCHDELLKPFASCFLCVVEVKGRPNLVPSCSTEAAPGMVVTTEGPRIFEARKTCLELLLSDHRGDCMAPCRKGCPGGLDIPRFIKHLAEGEDRDAIETIKERLAMPAMLGRVCPRPCEDVCRRKLVDEKAVAICDLKRFASDRDMFGDEVYVPARKPATGKRVAIVGAGPAGISAAFYLQQMGHACTLIDAHEKPGGMVRYGIPSYRLPRDVIEREVSVVERLGAEIRCGVRVGKDVTLDALRKDFDAVFIAVGAQGASRMDVPGEDSEGVLSGIAFLEACSKDETTPIGRRVMVVGGGNTAIDAARTAVRLGAAEVRILYRRTRKEMPAWAAEVSEAEHEGVKLDNLAAPTKIDRRADGSLEVTCIRMELGEPDSSGRRRPVPKPGSEFTVVVDNVIAAIGQRVDTGCLGQCQEGPARTRWATFVVNEKTLETSLPGVFAGGDCVIGPDIAIRAVAAGRLGAVSIDQHLRGEAVVGDPTAIHVWLDQEGREVPAGSYAHARPGDRAPMPAEPVAERVKTFVEVEQGYPDRTARAESLRCLECGCRFETNCLLRIHGAAYDASPTRYLGECRPFERDASHPEIVYESHKCIGCGTCVRLCAERLDVEFLGFLGRGFTARIGAPFGRKLGQMEIQGVTLLAERCPTGALCLQTSDARSS